MYFVYLLLCSDRKLYIGYSRDIKQRIKSHQKGSVTSTRHRRPVKLVYFETYSNKKDVQTREVYLKSGGGHEQIRKQHKNLLSNK